MSAISLKCPNCDGELIFDPGTQKYKCEYCNSLFLEEEIRPAEAESVESEAAAKSEAEAGILYTCPSCGAEIVTDATTAASFCYYCHNPVILKGRLEGAFLPDQIIPFSIDKETAKREFLQFFQKRKFIPKAFFQKNQMEHLSGVYFPYWVYRVSMKGRITAKGTNVRVWRGGDLEYTETSFYEIEREGDIELKDLTKSALKKANSVLGEGILPYRMEEAKAFSPGYLSGFLAEKRDIEKIEIQNGIQGETEQYAQKMLRESIRGYQTVTGVRSGFASKREQYAYTLFPIWTLTYRGRDDKIYYYSMNGQTGKVCGKLPIDYKKVLGTVFAAAGTVLMAGLLGGYFLW